ncbi:MAG TPA: adenylate/guanylate cyclase domain-containing protein [Solirubrobacteraceae bacterium]|nr:adenylate/guanylate cyclase domain-containing protein [Solirubrobacteraceae bacterium]
MLLLALVALGSAAIGLAFYATSLLASLEGSTINGRFSIRGTQRPPKNIVIVAIDQKTYGDLNAFPFPRSYYATLIDNLAPEHPAAIVFDIDLGSKSTIGKTCHVSGLTLPCDDYALLNAINNHPGLTVFATTQPLGGGQAYFLGYQTGAQLAQSVGSQLGAALFPSNQPGNVDRQMVRTATGLPTLYVVAAEAASHKRVTSAEFPGDQWIDYPGAQHTIPWISFSSVYDPAKYGPPDGWKHPLPPNYFRGKIVFVGVTQVSLEDYHATSTDGQMAGVEIEADATATVLEHFPLKSAPGWINIVLILLFAAAVPLASLRFGPLPSLALAVGLAGLFIVGTQVAFNAGRINSFVYPLGTLVLSSAGALSVQLVTEAFERIRTRDLFGRFVPENVVDQVLASADGLRLGGVQREATVLFSDVRGFTTLAETLTPPQVIEVLNHYLSEMSDAILNHGGTLVSYMGDGIFAVFGAPLELPDHADRAVAAAREMLEVRLPRFNAWLREEGLSEGVRMGIGLNSGHVMSGHVGSERRVEYAAVGDTTNTASRIEALTKGTPHQLLLSDSTRQALRSPPDDLIEVGETEIRGRQGHIKLWSIREGPEPEKVAEVAEPEPLPAPGPAM